MIPFLVVGGVWLFFFVMFDSKARGPYNMRSKSGGSNDTMFAAITATIITVILVGGAYCSAPHP